MLDSKSPTGQYNWPMLSHFNPEGLMEYELKRQFNIIFNKLTIFGAPLSA